MRKNFKVLGALAVAGVVATTGSAFTATSQIPTTSTVGAAKQSISGVNVTAAQYTWDAATDKTTGVVLTLGTALTTQDTLVVKITGTSVGQTPTVTTVTASCGAYTGVTSVTCTSTELTNATELSVVVS